MLPWLKGEEAREVQTMRDYLRVAFNRVPDRPYERSRLNRAVYRLIACRRAGGWIITLTPFPVELWARNTVEKVIAPPKPMVDAHQLSAEPVTC